MNIYTNNRKNMPQNTYWTLAFKWSIDENIYDLHGLWPEKLVTENTKKGQAFDEEILKNHVNLLYTLETIWNSDKHKCVKGVPEEQKQKILESADFKFWDHEWSHHGCYSGYDQLAYFELVVNLYNKFRPILPSDNEDHQLHIYMDENFKKISTDIIK